MMLNAMPNVLKGISIIIIIIYALKENAKILIINLVMMEMQKHAIIHAKILAMITQLKKISNVTKVLIAHLMIIIIIFIKHHMD